MAKVFTGRVKIPGDKLDEYFTALKQAEKERKPFRELLIGLNKEFHHQILEKFSTKTARKQSGVIQLFIDFLCRYTDVTKIEDITRGIVNTHFQSWWKKKVWDTTSPNEIRVALKKFFRFLADTKGIVNEKALKALK